jgi:hypothetical protein
LNIDTLEEARKELFKEDMRKLEAESVGRKNLRVQELQAEGSRGIW